MAAPAIVIGSIVMIVGAFLDWATGTGGTTVLGVQTTTSGISGYSLVDGRIVGALGVGLLIAGLLMWANRRLDSWFDADLLGVALSAFAIAQIGMWLMDINNEALSADYGIYVALAGGVIAFIGAIVALLGSRSDRATTDIDRSSNVSERRVA
ncbi:MAG TPA: hypothetical protein VHW68_12815 [Actinomycetota bacterium]|nr:hypothetical protein [Actinomycetota bacterium]